jgi:hypothetical protein
VLGASRESVCFLGYDIREFPFCLKTSCSKPNQNPPTFTFLTTIFAGSLLSTETLQQQSRGHEREEEAGSGVAAT